MVPRTLAWVLALLGGIASLAAQDGASTTTSSGSRPRITLLGASITDGFTDPGSQDWRGQRNETLPLKRALAALWPDGAVEIRNRASMMLFADTENLGERQIRLAQRDGSAFLVALDFAFWFGYGAFGHGEEAKARRLALQDKGLDLLSRISAPMLVGDYPDMTGADPRMLSRQQIPDAGTLAELNRRLLEWAKGRPNVRIFPMSDLVATVKKSGEKVVLGGKEVVIPPERLLQGDRLHATRLGMATLTARLLPALRDLLPESHPLRPKEMGQEQILDALGVLGEVQATQPSRPASRPQPAGR